MDIQISEHLSRLLSSSDKEVRANSEQLLAQMATHPDFLSSLSNIILNHQNSNIRLSATLYLKSLVANVTGDAKIVTSKLLELMKQPLLTQLRKIIAECIGGVVSRNDPNNLIRGALNNQVLVQLNAIDVSNSSIDLCELEYIIALLQVLITRYDEMTRIVLEGTLQKLLEIGSFLIKKYEVSLQTVSIIKMITECLETVFNLDDLEDNPTFNKLIFSPKFETFLNDILEFSSSDALLIFNSTNVYTPNEELINEAKSNALLILSRSTFTLTALLKKKNFIAQTSPFINKLGYYLQKCIYTSQVLLSSNLHYKQFKYTTLVKGINEMLKYCLALIRQPQFYMIFSTSSTLMIQIISSIIELTPEEKLGVVESPQEFIEMVREIMQGGHQHQISQFFKKENENLYSTRLIAAKLLIEVLCNVDGAGRTLFEETCVKVLHRPNVIDPVLSEKCILLLGIACNSLKSRDDLRSCISEFIKTQIDLIYESNQSDLDQKVYMVMKFVFITLYHSLNFKPSTEEEGHCQELFNLVENVFEANFQPAIQNPAILLATYGLLRSLLQLDTTYISKYTKILMAYFNEKLAGERPSISLLRSMRELCYCNKELETLTQSLLECVRKLLTHIHQEVKSTNINTTLINQIIELIGTISEIRPVANTEEWKRFFEQNLLTLLEYFNSSIFIEEKVVKIVIEMIKSYKTINTDQLKLIGYGVSFIEVYNKLGPFYELISISMVYGLQHYRTIPDLSTKVAQVCFTVLNKAVNILPCEVLRALILLIQLLQISRLHGTTTPEFLKLTYDTLSALSTKTDTDGLVKSNIVAAYSLIVCCQFNSQLLQKVVVASQTTTHSVLASKVLVVAFCDLILQRQTNIPQLFKAAFLQVLYICSHEAHIFKPDQTDDPEDYELEKQHLIESIFDTKWLSRFVQTHNLLKSSPQVYTGVLKIFAQAETVQLQRAARLQYTLYGIREIRMLKLPK